MALARTAPVARAEEPPATTVVDADGDGLPDAQEDELAARFAPVVYHSSDESNFPTTVDDFLAETSLRFVDHACGLNVPIERAPTQSDLGAHSFVGGCRRATASTSDGTRSRRKRCTFFLADVARDRRVGTLDSRRWTTYVHAYPDQGGGVTLQYWRFYAYNDAFNDHGGDWEGLHVVLDKALRPVRIRLLGHGSIDERPASEFTWEGTHVRVYSEGGGHATRASGDPIFARGCQVWPCHIDPDARATYVRHETWPGGRVQWPTGAVTSAGPIVNLGERARPKNGQEFIRYAGLWGSPGTFGFTSGYWGPAFNETGMRNDGFLTAWCAGMAHPSAEECYARDDAP